MPALLLSKKSITRSLSKKWNSVRGNNKNNNHSKSSNNISSCIIIDTTCTDDQMSHNDESPVPPLRSSPSPSTDKNEEEASNYYDGYNYCVPPPSTAADKSESIPEAAIVSDTSPDDDDSDSSSGGEDNAAEKYGYGDAVPDTETTSSVGEDNVVEKYGYGDAVPDTETTSSGGEDNAAEKYGYGDAVPDTETTSSGGEDNTTEKYGYGDAVPDTETKSFPRRLSTRNSIRRRSSICRQKPLLLNDDQNDDENLPFHSERAPRRSSFKGTCPTRAGARRRASISTCTTSSIEKELASGTIQPSQVLEIRVPGRRESIKRRTSITFNEDVNVRNIQAISKVKGAVKQELWFQDIEYSQIKKKTRALIEKVDSTGQFDGKKYCTRGLEKYMECPQKRASKKYQGWDSVLMEQEMQRNLQIYDDESISGFYKQTAQENVVAATNRAQLDAEEVASFYTTTDTTTVVATTIAADSAVAAARTRRGRRASAA